MTRKCSCGKELINFREHFLVCPECDFPDDKEMQEFIIKNHKMEVQENGDNRPL